MNLENYQMEQNFGQNGFILMNQIFLMISMIIMINLNFLNGMNY